MENRVDAERLRRLQLVTDAALAHLELDDLLAALLERVKEALGSDTVAILLLDEETDELVARAAVGVEEEVEQGVRVPVGAGFAGRVAAEQRPVQLPDVDHAHVHNPILRQKGIKTLLGVPLIVEGRTIGVLHVGTLRHHHFGEDDVELLQLAGDRAAIAIEHVRLFELERAVRMRLEHVQSVTDAALAHLELDELFAALLDRTKAALGSDTVAILLLDEETDELVARAAVGIEEEVEQGVRIPVGGGFAGTVAATRQPVQIPRVEPGRVLNQILLDKGIKTLLGVPLLVRDRVIGVLHVGTLRHHHFDDGDVELLQLVAERAALAIERARVHTEALRVNQLKLNFVAVASHELRTPAAAVFGILATLRGRGDELAPELRRELEETLWQQTERLRRLIEQLLDLSRLDADALTVEPQPVVLGRAVDDIVAASPVQPGDVEIDIDPDLAVVVDPLALERVLTNLLANAARYGAPPVTISADPRDRHLRLAVEDCGPGVPEELLPRMFERFERGLDAQGAGLGLAIAKAYARAHGGDLVYERHAKGARFELVLPR